MAKIDIRGLVPGKKYKMIIEADMGSYVSDVFPSISFTVPKAASHAKNYKLIAQQGTYDYKNPTTNKVSKKPKLTLTIPSEIYDDLIWRDDVRDIVYIIYRTGANKKIALRQNRKYLSSGDAFSFDDINNSGHAIASPPAAWTGHKKSFTIKVKDTNYYSFQFVIVRYIKDESGSWSSRLWLQGNKLKDILSKETAWGK